jgi:cation diffusion facilitator family transporter
MSEPRGGHGHDHGDAPEAARAPTQVDEHLEPGYDAALAPAHGHEHGDHGHAHGEHGHGDGGGHGHAHGGLDPALLGSREAMRTLGISLGVLGVTTLLQLVVVVVSGSVALLADTVHNFGDALTAVPLAAAFMLGRRPATRRLTYGWGRAEDFAGLAVVAIILFSAVFAAYEAIDRLVHPQTPGYLLPVAIAGVIGFVGNEWVAVYRIRTGRRIGSAALEADGYHARVDGFTSLAVVAGAAGVALGFDLADPLVGLGISLAIVRIVWKSLGEVGLRALDGIDPAVVDQITTDAAETPGVRDVRDVRARWIGHAIRAELAVTAEPRLSLAQADQLAEQVRARLRERNPLIGDALVRPVPAGHDARAPSASASAAAPA